MSHFTVLVIGENPEEQLMPFQENNMGDCPSQYMAFTDEEDEHVDQYETGTASKVVMPNGRLLSTWDAEFKVGSGFNSKNIVPDHLEKREVPFKELYPTFEQFMSGWSGHEERDEKTGRYGRWENPNAKWDWYKLGGRWTGFFQLKQGRDGQQGDPGLMKNKAEEGSCDSALKSAIDFEAMRQKARDEALVAYEKFASAMTGLAWPLSWTACRAKFADDIDSARTFYQSQPELKAVKDAGIDAWDCPFDTYGASREEYLTRRANSACTTFAVIKDGNWHERGSMGWWGCVSDEKDKDAWGAEYAKLIDDLPDETLLSVYDCHI